MVDIVSPKTRSRMMSGIRGKNTNPELFIRRKLYQRGLRYRIHVSRLPGKPDIVFWSRKAVIFIHGCFWHGHDCHLFRWPSSRKKFWKDKITKNRKNDLKACKALQKDGWRTLTIWECVLKGRQRLAEEKIADTVIHWVQEGKKSLELKGR